MRDCRVTTELAHECLRRMHCLQSCRKVDLCKSVELYCCWHLPLTKHNSWHCLATSFQLPLSILTFSLFEVAIFVHGRLECDRVMQTRFDVNCKGYTTVQELVCGKAIIPAYNAVLLEH
jgi:hypothetical protein